MSADSCWFVYILRTRTGSLYTGISTDVERRVHEHREGKRGARSLRGQAPLQLVWHCSAPDRSAASKLEAAVKRLPKRDKERIVRGELIPTV